MNSDYIYINGETPYYQSRLFVKHGIRHAFFSRKGGVSNGVFESLNFAAGSGDMRDSEENIVANNKIAASVFGLSEKDVCRSYQTHTANVELATEADRGRGLIKPPYDHGVDGMVTAEKDLLLSVRAADCVPILLCDTQKSVCAAVHSGWRGTVGGIAKNAVEMMLSKGAKTENIVAAIGPCIGACCYEVGSEVYGEFVAANGEYSAFFTPKGEKFMLDLNLANEFILQSCGISPENISRLDLCTKCNEAEFFSHRRDGVNRGTLSAFICL